MPLTITTSGYVEVWRDGVFVSKHTVETKAVESALAHSEANGDGRYELRFPTKILMSRLDRIYSATDTTPPLAPAGITAQALSGTSILVEWLPVTAPSGVTYSLERGDGTAYSVLTTTTGTQYTDTVGYGSHYHYRVRAYDSVPNYGGYSVSVEVTTPAFVDSAWLIPDTPYNLGTVSPGEVISTASLWAANDGTPTFSVVSATNSGGSAVSVSVDSSTGAITAPSTADTYTVVVDLTSDMPESDWQARSTGAGVIWAHDFRQQAELDKWRATSDDSLRSTRPTSWRDQQIESTGDAKLGDSQALVHRIRGTTITQEITRDTTRIYVTDASVFPDPATVGPYGRVNEFGVGETDLVLLGGGMTHQSDYSSSVRVTAT